MIITFGQQKGGTGKTTLATAFANYLTLFKKRKVLAYDYDYQQSLYGKFIKDQNDPEISLLPELYPVIQIENQEDENGNDIATIFEDFDHLNKLSLEEHIHLFDLAGSLDYKYSDLLMYSDFIITPFEYSDFSAEATLKFIWFLGQIEYSGKLLFVRSRVDKGFNYSTKEDLDSQLRQYGELIEHPVYKRNCLQSINTRLMTSDQKLAVRRTFDEIIYKIGI